jgi:XTP/dITP diphosphohydrolase
MENKLKYVLATSNPGKIAEMKEILAGFGIDAVTRKDLGIDIAVEETGTTFVENATIKAKSICSEAGIPAIADDSGLCIDALGGEPGVYSSSFGGEHLDDNGRCLYLLDLMSSVEQRGAKFVSTIVCAFPDGRLVTAQGECSGKIATRLRGTGGFGYDCVFIAEGYEKTMAQLRPEEKNAISHRGKALKEFSRLIMA